MKKHLVLIVNILLILGILSGVIYAMYRASKITENNKTIETAPSVSAEATVDEPTEAPEFYTIGIIQRSDVPNCNNIYQGFIAELATNGYINNNNIKLDYCLKEDKDECRAAVQKFIDSEYDLIFAIGPYATKLAASMTTEIPIVFGGVSEPEQENFVESNKTPGGNVTGVSDYTPCFEQIDSIKLMFPDTKKIGAIYYATDADSVAQAIIGEKEAKTEHVDIPYVKYPVKNKKELSSSLKDMLKDGVDVIYAPVDSFVMKNIETLVDFSHKNKIPVICGNSEMLSKGCFSTCVINYPSIGGAAGDMALDILYHDADPATIPIAYIYDCYLHINEETMKKLDVKLSDEILSTAILE